MRVQGVESGLAESSEVARPASRWAESVAVFVRQAEVLWVGGAARSRARGAGRGTPLLCPPGSREPRRGAWSGGLGRVQVHCHSLT